MGGLNKVQLIGNLGRDAELRYTPSGAAVSTLNLATEDVWINKSGQRESHTEWSRVVLWGKTAESLTEYLRKGKQIYVEGKLQTREWTDKQGQKRVTTEIRADRVILLGGGAPRQTNGGHVSDEQVANGQGASVDPAHFDNTPTYDDIPF